MDFYLAVMMETTEHLLDYAREAERLGYTGVALADHVAIPKGYRSVHPSGDRFFEEDALFPELMTTAAAMAAVTERLRLLSYVYILPQRDPFMVAKQAGNLAMLSNYRFVLGAGAGWLTEEVELLGFDASRRGRRFDEMLEIIRRFWRDGTAEFHGEFWNFDPVGMYPKPSGPIPIWIGGKTPAALRRAAHQDGWVGMNYELDEVFSLLGSLREERDRAAEQGWSPIEFETLVIPNAMPSPALYDDLAAAGVTSTVVSLWNLGQDPYERNLETMAAFAETFLHPR